MSHCVLVRFRHLFTYIALGSGMDMVLQPAPTPDCDFVGESQMHVLITGGAGFIGSHLAELCLAQGAHVSVIDDLSTGRIENVKPLLQHSEFTFVRETVLNEAVLDRLVADADVVVHLAAAVGVKLIVDHPVQSVEVNIQGTHNVLKCAARYRSAVLVASSSEVYGKGVNIPFSESDDILLGPSTVTRWSYAASKMVDEFLTLGYVQEFDLPAIVVRLFNTVGPRQTGAYGMVIPRLMSQALRGESLTVYGDGSQRRCFCDVRDVARALAGLVTEPRAIGHVLNVGGSEETSIDALAHRVLAMTGSNSTIRYIPYSEAYNANFEDIRRRVPDTTRIHQLIGWQPRIPLDTILVDIRDAMIDQPATG